LDTNQKAAQRDLNNEGEPWVEENGEEQWEENLEESHAEQKPIDEAVTTARKEEEPKRENSKSDPESRNGGAKSTFVNRLSVGLGIGCIATFVIMWIAIFFSPQLPAGATYESMLSIFIYPLVYLLAVGLIAVTAGIVREYYTAKVKV
jgi:hypothetical protein